MDLEAPAISKRPRGPSSEVVAAAAQSKAKKQTGAANMTTASGSAVAPGNMAQIVETMGKLVLTNTRELAQVSSACIVTLTSDKDAAKELLQVLKDCQVAYFENSKSMKPEQRRELLSPHLYVWQELCRWMHEKDPGAKELIQEHNRVLGLRMAELEGAGLPKERAKLLAIQEVVKVCRMSKCYDVQRHKLQFTTLEHARPVLQRFCTLAVTSMKANMTAGTAPRSATERQLQQLINPQ
eukprot:TRINITY_DN110965_c0_g1_i1.p1 TRINITY_DN110965_c0_g1~~TRINITY_DN110965_c0_g1_i1.p1  ORF type:complete len:239 (+),score=41.50 TRINITY_DN110965_c0_g1_i1:149-865(+)